MEPYSEVHPTNPDGKGARRRLRIRKVAMSPKTETPKDEVDPNLGQRINLVV